VEFRFYYDPIIDKLHIQKHNVSIEEIEEFFSEKTKRFKRQRKDKSIVAIGKLATGRFLEVIFRRMSKNLLFIIKAYDITDKETIKFLSLGEFEK